MTLLELAVQGVGGLPPTGRWSFGPGLNALVGSDLASEGFVRALSALLFSESLPFPGPPGARASLTFLGSDGGTYRLEGGAGVDVVLSELHQSAGRFVPAQAPGGVAGILRGLGLPELRLFEALCWWGLSGAARVEPIAKAPSSSPAFHGIENKLSALLRGGERRQARGSAELKVRLAELEEEEKAAEELAQLQDQIDALHQRLFRIEDQVKAVELLRADLERASRELASLPSASEEAIAQAKRLPDLAARRDGLLGRLRAEHAALEADDVAAPSLASLGHDGVFIGAVSVGAGAVAAAVIGSSFVPELRLLALLDIPGFGVAVLRACQHISRLRRRESLARELSLLAEQESRASHRFASDSQRGEAVMKELGASNLGELEERLAARAVLVERQKAAAEKLAALERDEQLQAELAGRGPLRQQALELEARLEGFSLYRRDTTEIRRERTELQAELARLGPQPGGMALAVGDRSPPDTLLDRGGELLGLAPAALCQAVSDRAAQLLSALSEGRYSQLAYLPEGVAFVPSGGAPLGWSQLPGGERPQCLWALRLALVERSLGTRKRFLLVDQRSLGEGTPPRQLLARMVESLAQSNQLLWLGDLAAAVENRKLVQLD